MYFTVYFTFFYYYFVLYVARTGCLVLTAGVLKFVWWQYDSKCTQTNMDEGKLWDESQLRKYDLKLEPIPRLSHDDPKVDELIAANVSLLLRFYLALCTFTFYGIRANACLVNAYSSIVHNIFLCMCTCVVTGSRNNETHLHHVML